MPIYLDFSKNGAHPTILWTTRPLLMYTWVGRCSAYLTTCLLWKLTSQSGHCLKHRPGAWGLQILCQETPPSVAGLLGDQGILKEGLGDRDI